MGNLKKKMRILCSLVLSVVQRNRFWFCSRTNGHFQTGEIGSCAEFRAVTVLLYSIGLWRPMYCRPLEKEHGALALQFVAGYIFASIGISS